MLTGQHEVMMLVKESAMECHQGLPLLWLQLVVGVLVGTLLIVDLDAFAFDHGKAYINPLNLIDELRKGDRPCAWLQVDVRVCWVAMRCERPRWDLEGDVWRVGRLICL